MLPYLKQAILRIKKNGYVKDVLEPNRTDF